MIKEQIFHVIRIACQRLKEKEVPPTDAKVGILLRQI